jgi:hypothetical protein
MRFVIGIIGAVCLGGMSLALADQQQTSPSSAAPASATSPSAAQSAASSSTSAAPAQAAAPTQGATPAQQATKQTVVVEGTPEVDPTEKHFLSEGYKLEMHNGEKLFCRREQEMGTRLGGQQKVCGTAQQLLATERESQRSVSKSMMQQNNPSGR